MLGRERLQVMTKHGVMTFCRTVVRTALDWTNALWPAHVKSALCIMRC